LHRAGGGQAGQGGLTGLLQTVRGCVRFFLVRLGPVLELYASPVNFEPQAPLFPISSPAEYAGELAEKLGTFYTTGMVEDHGGLCNGRLDEAAFLDQCDQALRERERMMAFELDRFQEGLFFCLFDTPDRVQHMFWRYREKEHPANRRTDYQSVPPNGDFAGETIIEEHYRRLDALLARAVAHADHHTLVIVLSGHGFQSFQRGMHFNTWLHQQGLFALPDGTQPGEETSECLHGVH